MHTTQHNSTLAENRSSETLLLQETSRLGGAIRRNAARYRAQLLPCTMWPDGQIPVPGELQDMANRLEYIERANGIANTRPIPDYQRAERIERELRTRTGLNIITTELSPGMWEAFTTDTRGTIHHETYGHTPLHALQILEYLIRRKAA